MSDAEVISELKKKKLPTFGTRGERLERLKKQLGIQEAKKKPRDKVLNKIEEIKQKRKDRRAQLVKRRAEKAAKAEMNQAMGKFGDVDFGRMIESKRFKTGLLLPHSSSLGMRLCVCVRKRPIFKKEFEAGENDSISCANPRIKIFDQKKRVDGITKYIDENIFEFDNTFNENEPTDVVYNSTLGPSLDLLFEGGLVTIFAYGQTSSGKTYTMQGLQEQAVEDIFRLRDELKPDSEIYIAFYEIYGGSCFDLLNNKQKVQILEDKYSNVCILGLVQELVESDGQMLEKIAFAFEQRTTHSTTANDTSSRSHAICKITVHDPISGDDGTLIVCDLAGSERAQDTKSNSRQRRLEGAEINKSLLALKECIRAMDSSGGYIPFRASKLTLSLRDSFISRRANVKMIMMACVCPGNTSADHTLNTLRYADRLKKKVIKPLKGKLMGFIYVVIYIHIYEFVYVFIYVFECINYSKEGDCLFILRFGGGLIERLSLTKRCCVFIKFEVFGY